MTTRAAQPKTRPERARSEAVTEPAQGQAEIACGRQANPAGGSDPSGDTQASLAPRSRDPRRASRDSIRCAGSAEPTVEATGGSSFTGGAGGGGLDNAEKSAEPATEQRAPANENAPKPEKRRVVYQLGQFRVVYVGSSKRPRLQRQFFGRWWGPAILVRSAEMGALLALMAKSGREYATAQSAVRMLLETMGELVKTADPARFAKLPPRVQQNVLQATGETLAKIGKRFRG